MVLSANDLGIREGLDPVFCYSCGGRIGWCSDDSPYEDCAFQCEECARNKDGDKDE